MATFNAKKAALQTALAEKTAAIEAATDAKSAASLLAEAKEIKSELESIQATEDGLAELKSAQNTPVNGTRFDATGSKGKVGSVEIDLLTGQVVDEQGAGVLPKSRLIAIAQKSYTEAWTDWARSSGNEGEMKSGRKGVADLSEGLDANGGYLVPAEVVAGIIMRKPGRTRVVDNIATVPVGSDRALIAQSIYNSDDLYASNVRIYKTGEAQAAQNAGKPQFGLKAIDVHGYTGEITISKRLLQDTNFDILGHITEQFRIAVRNLTADKSLRGSGVGEHFGMLTLAGQANRGPDIVKTGDANLITWDAFRRLKNAVPEQYDDNCRYLFNKRSTLDALEALLDANDRPLWPEQQRSGLTAGQPGTLHGYAYDLDAFMPDIAANAYPALFGDFTGYTRVSRVAMTIQVLREIEARNGQVVFLVEFREGGDVTEPWKLRALKVST